MYDWASGIRGDVTLGPVFFIGGDVDHFEMPLAVTVGYNFWRTADISPYVRAGVVYHFASGDFYSSSTPGVLAAAGLDFERFSLEVAVDTSEVEFDAFACNASGSAMSARDDGIQHLRRRREPSSGNSGRIEIAVGSSATLTPF